jgi:hypothetical protein
MRNGWLPALVVLVTSCNEDVIPFDAVDASVSPPGGYRRAADPVLCGNRRLDPGEVCDDGFRSRCGECNADCSGSGSGSVCGDGILCRETEICDDGGTDDCGPCNADCSGNGTGSVCGDGTVCPDTEACDDGFTDACGSCNATCTAEGEGSDCTDHALCPETELCVKAAIRDDCRDECGCPEAYLEPRCTGFGSNAEDVYFYTLQSTEQRDDGGQPIHKWVYGNVLAMQTFKAGGTSNDTGHFINPLDGNTVYFRRGGGDGGIYRFVCDACPWTGGAYPEAPGANDIGADENAWYAHACIPAAGHGVQGLRVSPDGLILHQCTEAIDEELWYDNSRTVVPIVGQLLHLGYAGAALVSFGGGGVAIQNLRGGPEPAVSGFPVDGSPVAFRAVPPVFGSGPGAFRVVLERAFTEELYTIDATTGEATLVTTYHSERPMPVYSRVLGVQGDLFTVSTTDASTTPPTIDILRFPADGSPYEVLTGTGFVPRADTTLFSGP